MKKIHLRDGMRIAYQEWGNANKKLPAKKILALHGWLDNSNSFGILGPHLASLGYHFVAIDHLGHGRSSHLSPDASYSSWSGISRVDEVMEHLEWDKANVLGHSMGAGMSFLFAGCFPEKIDKLILIEGLGPNVAAPGRAAKNLRKAIEDDKRFTKRQAQKDVGGKIYQTFEEAVTARINSVSAYPGFQTLSVQAAKLLVGRFVAVLQMF